MCGIVGVVARSPVNQLLYDGMTVLQHRGQDAAGIVTAEGHSFHMHKGRGLVRDVFRTRDMRSLVGRWGHIDAEDVSRMTNDISTACAWWPRPPAPGPGCPRSPAG